MQDAHRHNSHLGSVFKMMRGFQGMLNSGRIISSSPWLGLIYLFKQRMEFARRMDRAF
jgi:hypothetical protein